MAMTHMTINNRLHVGLKTQKEVDAAFPGFLFVLFPFSGMKRRWRHRTEGTLAIHLNANKDCLLRLHQRPPVGGLWMKADLDFFLERTAHGYILYIGRKKPLSDCPLSPRHLEMLGGKMLSLDCLSFSMLYSLTTTQLGNQRARISRLYFNLNFY